MGEGFLLRSDADVESAAGMGGGCEVQRGDWAMRCEPPTDAQHCVVLDGDGGGESSSRFFVCYDGPGRVFHCVRHRRPEVGL